MLTDRDRQLQAETGLIPPDRMDALRFALNSLADDARAASHRLPKDTHAAAALRGKSRAYREAALMVRHISNGQALHPRASSSARERAREWGRRRNERRERRDDQRS